MSDKTAITLTINGRDYPINVEPRRTLADAIREDCGQTGTHIGCEHGICGACTVIVSGEPVRACLMFAVQADGKKIRTVEGLAQGDRLHPMQQAFMDHHGLQCGFCTPGFLMLAVGVLEREPDISDDGLLDVLSSNLCRCTGYQNIIKAVRSVLSGKKLVAPPVFVGALAFVGAALASVPFAASGEAAAAKFLLLTGSVFIYLLIALFLDDWHALRPIFAALLLVGLLVSGHALWQYGTGELSRVGFVSATGAVEYRVSSFFPHPNQLAGFVVIFVPLAVGLYAVFESRLARAA